jgi:hypothetical protein
MQRHKGSGKSARTTQALDAEKTASVTLLAEYPADV